MMKKFFSVLFLVCALVSCKDAKKTPNVDNIDVNIEVVRFDKDIFSINDVSVLREKYGMFFDNFCHFVLGIGTQDSASFENNLNLFRNDSIVLLAQNKAAAILDDYEKTLNAELTKSFKLYKYYFPKNEIPQIYIYTSGFNQSLILDENIIGVGMDKYLGDDEPVYVALGFSKYLVQNMRKEQITGDVIGVLALDIIQFDAVRYTLIEKMIYEGKLLYFKQQLCPYLSENDLFGFTKDQLKFCKNNEAQMWTHLVENKLLYSDDYVTITKFTEYAPFTPEFTDDSPGKAANWIGFKIVEKYMNKTNASLLELINEKKHEKILREAKYSPK
jgi:hypothetical protein